MSAPSASETPEVIRPTCRVKAPNPPKESGDCTPDASPTCSGGRRAYVRITIRIRASHEASSDLHHAIEAGRERRVLVRGEETEKSAAERETPKGNALLEEQRT